MDGSLNDPEAKVVRVPEYNIDCFKFGKSIK